ncbi:MAG: hypothetical protein IJR85_04835 [Synergistaceae bacterium]|nr:hypothetical protein [Synergistaceae bacterium]
MSYLSVKYVPDASLLPATLVEGRLYFVGDEQVIILDSGDGPKIYGAASAPAVYYHTDSSPSLKEQIDALAEADLNAGLNYWAESVRTRREISRLEARIELLTSRLQEQATSNAEGILQLEQAIQAEADKTDNEIAALAKTITKFHPYAEDSGSSYDPSADDPLDNETLATDAGSWTIQQTYNADGTVTYELTAQELYIDTLTVGDTVNYDGQAWTVTNYQKGENGVITLSINQ